MTAVGTVIGGRFRVDQRVGAGGMGVVVAATHLELGHRVAIKFLHDDMAQVPTVVERFLREARSVVHLRTEHICRVIDVGRTDAGAPYIVMELLDGSDLGRVVAKQPLPLTIAVEYVMQACVALAEAHAAGIVHRDLKPANLLVTRRPDGGPLIKVLDFGIAKALSEADAHLTRSHSVLGSPGYMSPEQLHSARDVDARTDIWALGATLYQLMSARLPFYRANATEMAVRIVMEPPDPLDIDPALRAVVFRCLEKSPAKRYPDVTALVADLVPFGGPSARAIAVAVGTLARGSSAASTPAAVVSPLAMTAASSVASGAGVAGVGGAAGVAGVGGVAGVAGLAPASWVAPAPWVPAAPVVAAGSPAAPRGDPDDALVASRRRRWWLLAPLVALIAVGAVGAVLVRGRHDATKGITAGSAIAEARAPIDAAVAPPPPDAAALVAVPVATAPAPPADPRPRAPGPTPPRLKDPKPKDPRPRPPKLAAAPAAHAPDPRAAPAVSGRADDHAKPPTIAGGLADSAREMKATCFESAGDTPWNTAMCWCTKKDQARAQAAFAKLAGFKRMTVRKYCAVRGVNL